MIGMDEKKKEWIKKNWINMVVHCIPVCIWMIVVFTLIDLISVFYFEDNMLLSIYGTIIIFGGLIFMTLGMMYLEMWAKKMGKYREDYDKHMEK